MDIRDVIGELRERDLALQNEINALRLAIHLCEYRLSKLEPVSRETKGDKENGDETTELPGAATPAPAEEADLGKVRPRRDRKPRRDVQRVAPEQL